MTRAPASGLLPVLLADRHQAGHLLLGEANLFAAEFGQREILHLERLASGCPGRLERVHFSATVAIAVSCDSYEVTKPDESSQLGVRVFVRCSCCDKKALALCSRVRGNATI